jgi:hypothetical protein
MVMLRLGLQTPRRVTQGWGPRRKRAWRASTCGVPQGFLCQGMRPLARGLAWLVPAIEW